MDCFCIGRLAGTNGVVWQYTAIDAASAFTWAELHVSRTTPTPAAPAGSHAASPESSPPPAGSSSASRPTVARSSAARSSHEIKRLGAVHTRISPGRPQSNGFVERVQRTVLEECWKPAFARYLVPKYGLRRELERYLVHYNFDRTHNGRLTKGRIPADVLGAAKMYR